MSLVLFTQWHFKRVECCLTVSGSCFVAAAASHLHSHLMTQMCERGKSFLFWIHFTATWIHTSSKHTVLVLYCDGEVSWALSPTLHLQHGSMTVLIIISLSTAISAKTPFLVTSKNIVTEVLGCSASDVLQIQRRSRRNGVNSPFFPRWHKFLFSRHFAPPVSGFAETTWCLW